jgi:D-arabinose 5-phosphate isomerase GutQ
VHAHWSSPEPVIEIRVGPVHRYMPSPANERSHDSASPLFRPSSAPERRPLRIVGARSSAVVDEASILDRAKRVLAIEADAVRKIGERLGSELAEAVALLLHTPGKVVVTGMGKSGLIGKKIAATMASTGTPAYFLHPAEAVHGDLGLVRCGDVVVALSNSGETAELLSILPSLEQLAAPIIALTGRRDSALGRAAAVVLDVGVDEEACPLGLLPTASTTAALAMGDALAVALAEAKGFGEEDFARSHPGGALGRRLRGAVGDDGRMDAQLPPPWPWTRAGSHGDLTVRQRLPKIVAMYARENPRRGRAVRAMQELCSRILADDVVITDHLFEPTEHWATKLRAWQGLRYSQLSFLELEFLFYHALACHHGFFVRGRDPFADLKRRDVIASVDEAERAATLLESGRSSGGLEPLELALRWALLGNALDASQTKQRDEISRDIRLVDGDLAHVARTLASASSRARRVSVILDNAGTELGMDLLLVHQILETTDCPVVLHAKPWPMFVSDATSADVLAHIACWRRSTPPHGRLSRVATELEAAMRAGRLEIRDEPDWGEPRCFDELGPKTLAGLGDALVILKGDLNSRRFFGDRMWSPTTSVEGAARGIGFESILLRTLKSDLVVGLCEDRLAALGAEDEAWSTNGRYAVAQRIPSQDGEPARELGCTRVPRTPVGAGVVS